jgi:hypothetical protein
MPNMPCSSGPVRKELGVAGLSIADLLYLDFSTMSLSENRIPPFRDMLCFEPVRRRGRRVLP